MPLLTLNELSSSYAVRKKLSKDQLEWFMNETGKIESETHCLFTRRDSSDSAFRMYLLGATDMTVEQIGNLDQLPVGELYKLMQQYINDIGDTKKTAAQKVERMGAVHKKALEKINDYTIPDMGVIKSINDLERIQKTFYAISLMEIDYTQDTDPITKPDTHYTDLRSCYRKGLGGVVVPERQVAKWSILGQWFYNSHKKLFDPNINKASKCALLDYTREFFAKYGGKKIGQLPTSIAENVTCMGINYEVLAGPYNKKDNPKPFDDYLNGSSNEYPGKKAVDEQVREVVKGTLLSANDSNENLMMPLENMVMEPVISGLLNDEQKKMKDLTELPAETKAKMIALYNSTFGMAYTGTLLFNIYDMGYDQFDLIKTSSGKSIRQLSGDTYSKYDEMTKEEAMILETIRAMATEKNGLTAQYVKMNLEEKLELSDKKKVKRIPDSYIMTVDSGITEAEAEEYLKNPNPNSQASRAAVTQIVKVEKELANQKPLMEKYGLDFFDMFYVGDKSIRQLAEKHIGSKFAPGDAFAFVLAASYGDKPIFMTVLSEENGHLKKTALPVNFRGKDLRKGMSRDGVLSSDKKAGQKIIAKEPQINAKGDFVSNNDEMMDDEVILDDDVNNAIHVEEAPRQSEKPQKEQPQKEQPQKEQPQNLQPKNVQAKKVDMFSTGKYGQVNGYYQLVNNTPALMMIIPYLNDQELMNTQLSLISDAQTNANKDILDPGINISGGQTLKDCLKPEMNQRVKNHIKNVQEKAKRLLDNPPDEFKYTLGKLKIFINYLETEKGNYSEVYYGNPLIKELEGLLANTVRLERNGALNALTDSVDPVTKEKVPLAYINNFYEHVNELIELEYEKQRITLNPSPEAEKLYLEKLSNLFTRFNDNMDCFRKFNDKITDKTNGKTKYDDYFDNCLDMFTGTSINGTDNRRNIKSSEERIRGLNQAIKNGWGMNEINYLGDFAAVESLLKSYLQIHIADNNPAACDRKIQLKNNKIQEYNQRIQNEKNKLRNANRDQKAIINAKIRDYQSSIENMKTDIEKTKKIKASYEKIKAEFESHIKAIEAVKKDIWNNAVTTDLDRYKVVSKINQIYTSVEKSYEKKLLNENTHLLGVINDAKSRYQQVLSFGNVLKADPYMGRKTVKLPEDIMDEKFMTNQEGLFVAKYIFNQLDATFISKHKELEDMVNGKNELEMSVDDLLNQGVDEGLDRPVYTKKSLMGEDHGIKLEGIFDSKQNKAVKKMSQKIHDSYKKNIDETPAEERVFKPIMQHMLKQFDTKDVSLLKAVTDNGILRHHIALTNFGPAIYKDDRWENYQSPMDVKNILTGDGTLLPSVLVFNSSSEMLDAEYQKQRDMKTGWDREKEQRYFFNLSRAYEKSIKAYEELVKWPSDIQLRAHYGYEDAMGDITDIDSLRGISATSVMMKWEMQAMKNGWHADNIHVMGAMGGIEGTILRAKVQLLHEIEQKKKTIAESGKQNIVNAAREALTKIENQLKVIREFDKEYLSPFKKQMWNKKIESPQDVLDVLNQYDRLVEKITTLKLDESLASRDKFLGFHEKYKTYIDNVNNKTIEDAKKSLKKPAEIKAKYTPTEVPEYKDESKEMLRFISNVKNIPANAAVEILSDYVRKQYLSTLYRPDYPEFFDKNNNNWKWANNMLHNQTDKYAREFITKIAGSKKNMANFKISGKNLADFMKYGHHEVYFNEIKNETKLSMDKEGYELMVNRKLEKADKTQITMMDALKESYKDLVNAYSISGSNFYDEATDELERIIKMKNSIDKDLKRKKMQGKDCTMDPKKYKEYKKKVNSLLGAVHGYIMKKDQLRRRKGGNLGTTGEKRYKAMHKTMSALNILKQAIDRYNNRGPLAVDLNHDFKKAYGTTPEATVNYIENMQLFATEEIAKINGKTDTILAKEEGVRKDLSRAGDIGMQDIVKSAERTLYLSTIKKAHNVDLKAHNGNPDSIKSLMETENIVKEYDVMMADYAKSKDNSSKYKEFKSNYLDNRNFKEEFAKEIKNSVKNGKYDTEDILKCRDNALKTAFSKNKANAAEIGKLSEIAKMTGSAVKADGLGVQVQVNKNVNRENQKDDIKKGPKK